jgi:hypothetical protein
MIPRASLPFLAPLLLPLMAGWGIAAASSSPYENWVLKIEVIRNDGSKDLGSGVVIAPERLVTNCHVVSNASQIKVSRGNESWLASAEMGDAYRDICQIRLPGFTGKPPAIAEPGRIRVGESVFAAGYSGGEFTVSKGNVKGLFTCACDGGKVIQTSAHFAPGASGGGLFDDKGQLLGILTFKSHSGGSFHFAIPIGWMKQLSATPVPAISDQGPFWKSPSHSSGYFLAACDLSAKQKWLELLRLAQEWVREEPYNPQAWMASGRANLGLRHLREAAGDFQKVLDLDSTHAEAWWELEKLELELGESLTGS